jgi:DNA polymerase V
MIALVDCNNFYVSCERLVDPTLKDVPVVVLSNNDGVVISRSNEVKAMGVGMAGPAYQYRDLFKKNGVRVFSANFNLYMQISEQVMSAVREYSPSVEVYSVDEAFLDLGGLEWKNPSAYLALLREFILNDVGIPVSVGIAESKTLTKVASEFAKKDPSLNGVMNMYGDPKRNEYLAKLPVGDLWGVGRQFAKLLEEEQITNALELVEKPDLWVLNRLHIGGLKMVWELRGIPCIPFEANLPPPKQIMRSRSFGKYVETLGELKEAAAHFMSTAAESLRSHGLVAGVAGVFLHANRFNPNEEERYSNSASSALLQPTSHTPTLIAHIEPLLEKIFKGGIRYQKLGIILTELKKADTMQLTLTYEDGSQAKEEAVMRALDTINAKYKENHLVRLAAEGTKFDWASKQEHLSTQTHAYADPKGRTRFGTTISVPSASMQGQKKGRHTLEPAQQGRALGKQVAERIMRNG